MDIRIDYYKSHVYNLKPVIRAMRFFKLIGFKSNPFSYDKVNTQ